MTAGLRPTVVEVDLDAVRHNVGLLLPDGAGLMAVVKADGYGHGAPPVARAAVEAGASWLGVALVEEGIVLRDAGISDTPILVLSECPPGAEEPALAAGLTPSLYSEAGLRRLVAVTHGRPQRVHVKVDTGMGRVGMPADAVVGFLDKVRSHGLTLEAMWTHFARADEPVSTTSEQLLRFREAVDAAGKAGHEPTLLHAANTAATIDHPQTHLDLVRPGIGLYGIEPAPGIGGGLGLRPALTWRSRVAFVKRVVAGTPVSYGHTYAPRTDSWFATVPVGYADGYPRGVSSRAEVLIRGARHRVAGIVTMDQTIVDCGDVAIEAGDDVVLIGEQGGERISADELGSHAGTIGYEIVTRIGPRVPREYP